MCDRRARSGKSPRRTRGADSASLDYTQGDALPDTLLTWPGGPVDLDHHYALSVRVGRVGEPAAFEKSTGLTGSLGAPVVTIAWETTDLGTLPPGDYVVQIRAVQNATGRRLTLKRRLVVSPGVL